MDVADVDGVFDCSEAKLVGFTNPGRGSDGCLTLQPQDWSDFIQLFLDGFPDIDDWHELYTNTGKKIGSLVIQS